MVYKFKTPKFKTFYKSLHFNQISNTVEPYLHVQSYLSRSSHATLNKTLVFLARPQFFARQLRNLTFIDSGYNLFRRKFFNPTKALSLNFTRGKFFPTLRTIEGESYFFLSLGLLAKFLLKGKAFTKSKTVFILLASFLRKVLLFSSFKNIYLFINKTPLYFKEIMSTINDPVVSIYKNPFSNQLMNEKEINNPFSFPLIIFTNNKSYGFMKEKQKGRLKRKIARRLTLINKVLD